MAASKNTNSNHTNLNNVLTQLQQVQQQAAVAATSSSTVCPVTQSLIQTQAQPHSPALSTASSLVSPDSSATNPISSVSSPDISFSGGIQTPQNTPQADSPQTPLVPGSNIDSLDDVDKSEFIDDQSASTTPTNSSPLTHRTPKATATNTNDNKTNNQESTFSPKKDSCLENDVKSSGSVLEKKSMFENLEQLQTVDGKQQPTSGSCTSLNTQNFTLPSSINTNLTPATVARLESIYGKRQIEEKEKEKEKSVDRETG